MRNARSLGTAGLLLLGVALSVGIAEAILRGLVPDGYYVWPPRLEESFDRDPAVLPGVQGPARLTINSFGVRGDEWDGRERYRLLAVGGSTTLCAYLDDAEAWPHRVQERLNATLGDGLVWVGNVGRPGHTTVQHRLQVEKLLEQHPELDGVLLLVGVNDLLITLALTLEPPTAGPGGGRRLGDLSPAQLAFSVTPGVDAGAPWYRRSAIARFWTIRSQPRVPLVPSELRLDEAGGLVQRQRAYRRQASRLRRELPDLAPHLARYVRDLEAIVDLAHAAGARVLFLTQPALWRADLPEADRDLLWTGGPPLDRARSGVEYYAVEALAEGMRRYNEALLGLCGRRGVECLDLAALVPRARSMFYDDVHFTVAGASLVADLVAAHLLWTEPLHSLR